MLADKFVLRRADAVERRRLLTTLLPPGGADDTEVFFASSSVGEKPDGTAAVRFFPSRHFPEQATCFVRVTEPHTGQGIGRALMQRVIATARETSARKLHTLPLDENSPACEFVRACGFEFGPVTICCEAPSEDFANVTRPVYRRLLDRGKIPPDARLIALRDAPRDEVCRLVLDNLGFSSQHVAERLRGTEHGFSQTLSRVALLNGAVVGALLITYQKVLASVDATAVLPVHRHTWVNAALKYSAVEALLERGVQRIRFSANSAEHPDTAKLARRVNARILQRIVVGTLQLERDSS